MVVNKMSSERVRRLVSSLSSQASEALSSSGGTAGSRTARSILAEVAKTSEGSSKANVDSYGKYKYSELWDGLDACLEQADAGKQCSKELATALERWAATEKAYVSGLPYTRKRLEQPVVSGDDLSSLGAALDSFAVGFIKTGESRARLASLTGAMGAQLNAFRREQSAAKRKLELEGHKLRKGMQLQEQSCTRTKQKYEKCCKDAELCIQLKEKAHQEKALHEVSKLWQRTTDALIAVQESERAYQIAVEELQAYRAGYRAQMARVLDELQLLEGSRSEYVKALMHGIVDSYTELAKQFDEALAELRECVDEADSKKDMDTFVKRHLRPAPDPVRFEKYDNPKIDAEIDILVGGGGIMLVNKNGAGQAVAVTPGTRLAATLPQKPPLQHVPPPMPSRPASPTHSIASNTSSIPSRYSAPHASPSIPQRNIPVLHQRSVSVTDTLEILTDQPHLSTATSSLTGSKYSGDLLSTSGNPSRVEKAGNGCCSTPTSLASSSTLSPAPATLTSSGLSSPDQFAFSKEAPAQDSGEPISEAAATASFVRVLYDYTAEEDTELSLRAGDILKVVEKDDSGWWEGEMLNGAIGSFPENYTAAVSPQAAASHGFDVAGGAADQTLCAVTSLPPLQQQSFSTGVASQIASAAANIVSARQPSQVVDEDNNEEGASEETATEDEFEEVFEHYDEHKSEDSSDLIEAERENSSIDNVNACTEQPPCKQVVAIFDYIAQDPSDLTIKKQDVLTVHGMDKDGGWLDASNALGVRGMCPRNHTVPMANPSMSA